MDEQKVAGELVRIAKDLVAGPMYQKGLPELLENVVDDLNRRNWNVGNRSENNLELKVTGGARIQSGKDMVKLGQVRFVVFLRIIHPGQWPDVEDWAKTEFPNGERQLRSAKKAIDSAISQYGSAEDAKLDGAKLSRGGVIMGYYFPLKLKALAPGDVWNEESRSQLDGLARTHIRSWEVEEDRGEIIWGSGRSDYWDDEGDRIVDPGDWRDAWDFAYAVRKTFPKLDVDVEEGDKGAVYVRVVI